MAQIDIATFDRHWNCADILFTAQYGDLEDFQYQYLQAGDRWEGHNLGATTLEVSTLPIQAFLYAVKAGNFDIAEWLLDIKALSPYEYDESGDNSLCMLPEIIESPYLLKILTLFYEHGMEPTWTWTDERTYLHLLRTYLPGNEEGLHNFIDKWGLDINVQDRDGNTPFLYAFRCQRYAYCQALIQCGANTEIKNKDGHTWRSYLPPLPSIRNYSKNSDVNSALDYILKIVEKHKQI